MTPLPALLTTGQAADRLGVSIGTVRRWAKTGRLTHIVTPSGRIRFRVVDLDAALREVQGEPVVPTSAGAGSTAPLEVA
jgi:excisionase family DNA binding protein